jgi:hypothetical protein
MKIVLGWENKAAHGIMVTHGIMPHGIAMEGQFEISREKVP